MTATIAYDLPIKNLIDALVRTGHVTTKEFRKDSVTLHHNAGRLSHEGVLSVWKVRPASAHFDIDGKGAPCQYAKVPWYCWAVGNTVGNQRTISIEMANSTLAPAWEVATATWKGAARLAGWLFAKVIGKAPSSSNFFMHSHWAATACAGPYIKRIWAQIQAEALKWYNYFKGKPTGATPKPPASSIPNLPASSLFSRTKVKALQHYLETTEDGKWGAGTDALANHVRDVAFKNSRARDDVVVVQRIVDVAVDGIRGPKTDAALRSWVRYLQRLVGAADDGDWGAKTDAKYLAFRKANLNKF
jgi:hypothetical protein